MVFLTVIWRASSHRCKIGCYLCRSGMAPTIKRHTATGRHVLLLSSSTVHGSDYLEFASGEVNKLLQQCDVSCILFIPYALRDYDGYADKISAAFMMWGYKVNSIHKAKSPMEAVRNAEAFYVGGGNTFQLLKTLYDQKLIEPIRKRVLEEGVPYIGSSAGSNVATISICTTNDMPIVYPPSFTSLGLVPFNVNPHYLDSIPTTYMGETREERIQQYHEIPGVPPVVGLREGSLLLIEGNTVTLKGNKGARIFMPGKDPKEYETGSDLSFLLKGMCS
ncbi:alpha-aspartyl dipeptidase-like [Periplaneta americana]|uniref:alpha-aspartyl dipeptidase-like n=1 Tax=Periplaneta americana TaxID=6978 RepID=UPI0037E98507